MSDVNGDVEIRERRHYSPSATIIESSRLLPWLVVLAIMCGVSISFSCFTFYQLIRTQRTYDLLDLQLRDQNAILIREGLKQPTDLAHGPACNYQYQPRRN